ncbi:hypothetical protein DPMN_014317 [Dreissena polymorpha]|uniref:Uncharacterized protein n=1 Tax=Dreissena polymorpha TaxID=45954 RepID=A0A9D4NAJ5_DREPO|nr:hypothetical protein DPMN_014317 [Dreissena polymorpha]
MLTNFRRVSDARHVHFLRISSKSRSCPVGQALLTSFVIISQTRRFLKCTDEVFCLLYIISLYLSISFKSASISGQVKFGFRLIRFPSIVYNNTLKLKYFRIVIQ